MITYRAPAPKHKTSRAKPRDPALSASSPMRRRGRRFITRKIPRIKEKNFGTFDIETYGLGGPFLDATTYDEMRGGLRHRTVDELWSYLLSVSADKKNFIWYAHAGARYDFAYLAIKIRQFAIENKVTVETIQQGTKIIGLILPINLTSIRIYDSFPLLQNSLANAARAFAPEYAKLAHCKTHDFTKGKYYSVGCSYCVEYMMRDAESLYHIMRNVREVVIETFGVEPGLTTGSTAMRAWIATIPEGNVYYRQSPAKEAFLRRVGAGSLTYPGHDSDRWENAITVDRSAAFAACMMEGGYPTSTGIWTGTFNENYFGCYHVECSSPANLTFPVLPAYTENGRKFAVGNFESYITSDQYRIARELGYQLKVIKGLYFKRCENIFDEFIGKCEDLEYPPDGSPANPAVKAMTKHIRNSLNGKFNIRETMERIYIGEYELNSPDKRQWVDEETGKALPGYTMTEYVDAPYCQPVWYAITVVRQQLAMIRLLLLLNPSERGKVDTDSLTIRAHSLARLPIEIGPGYGKFKVEHEWAWVQSLGVKNYLGEEKDGTFLNYCKGIPRNIIRDFRDAHMGCAQGTKTQVTFTSLRTLKDMLKTGLATPAIMRKRSISIPATSVGWIWDELTHQFNPIQLGAQNV